MLTTPTTIMNTSPKENPLEAPNQALMLGMSKLKSSTNSSLCKRVLLINSMDVIVDKTSPNVLSNLAFQYRNKQEWRRAMVKEYISSPDNPDISFDIVNSPIVPSIDSLSVLLNCLEITKKKKRNVKKLEASMDMRAVKIKTIEKNKPFWQMKAATKKKN
ncbi:hypothetical protein K502DRAFT_349215 [Neoconidiobolus thromboides FSU 785]|nr:hypothetical protein K502DRAFT_349215 [Neoconidiobolus thromboides FSU 785]